MKLGKCKWCGREKHLVRAHIIPAALCLEAKGDSTALLETRPSSRRPVQHWQNGIWDDGILCEGCEGKLKQWDDYGIEFFRKPPGADKMPHYATEIEPFILKDADYPLLKLFVLSVLWRASVCREPFFSEIGLGPHETLIANMLDKRDPGVPEDYAVILHRLVDWSVPSVMFKPRRYRTPEGVNFCLLYLPSTRIEIKVDRRPLPRMQEAFILRPQPENIVVPMCVVNAERRELQAARQPVREWLEKRRRK